jgi:hypothetical protein
MPKTKCVAPGYHRTIDGKHGLILHHNGYYKTNEWWVVRYYGNKAVPACYAGSKLSEAKVKLNAVAAHEELWQELIHAYVRYIKTGNGRREYDNLRNRYLSVGMSDAEGMLREWHAVARGVTPTSDWKWDPPRDDIAKATMSDPLV